MVPQRCIESCTLKLQNWSPFRISVTPKTLDSDPKPCYYSSSAAVNYSKRPCRADRATSFTADAIDMSRLSLMDEDRTASSHTKLRWFARKRRRRGSRSVSGRSSDRSGTRRRCCSVGASAAYGTCSDIPVTVAGTDSSGELFLNGDLNWGSDVSEAGGGGGRRERDEKENLSSGLENQGGNESGYGSEPGYRGDAELGYGDELDEEEDDQRGVLFWGDVNSKIVIMVMQQRWRWVIRIRCRKPTIDAAERSTM